MRTLHLGRKQGEREGTDEDGEEDVHYDTRVGLTAADEGGAEVEGERVGAVDDEEEAGQTGAVGDGGFEVLILLLNRLDVRRRRVAVDLGRTGRRS